MKYLSQLFFLVIATGLLHSCTQSPPPLESGVSLDLAQYRKSQITDLHYKLDLHIPEEQSAPIEASEIIRFNLKNAEENLPLDFRESIEHVHSLSVNGQAADIDLRKEHLILPANLLQAGENEIKIAFIAGESSLNRNPEYLYTLFVPDRARTAFPLFDQPDLKATYELRLQIPKSWEGMSNAPLANESSTDSTRILDFATSDLISSYLFSFVAGDFESVSRNVEGVEMTLLHRETDTEKVERNLDDIFRLHKASLDWLEEYTGIPYPFQKFGFALIPNFQYGGMEHVGAIQYRASGLFLEQDPSDSQLLGRASLIAHETAHMWFGDLVTMEWFNDVWTKEVFANFMAAKIVNPSFPDINHELNFLVRHHPAAYSVDRTQGANAIRQELNNLNEAGQMYGAIIYNKAPIMMRQLELLIGEDIFREGMQEYLGTYAFGNATWPALINILDAKTSFDLKEWSEVWVNTPGRPHFEVQNQGSRRQYQLLLNDPAGIDRVWPQEFTILEQTKISEISHPLRVVSNQTPYSLDDPQSFYFNADGYGYGLFPARLQPLSVWRELNDVTKGSELINLYENLLEQNDIEPEPYFLFLQELIQMEDNSLLLNLALGQLNSIYWDLLTAERREELTEGLENILWAEMNRREESSKKKTFFNAFQSVAQTDDQLRKVYEIWQEEREVKGLNLSENDFIGMAGNLAVKMPEQADDIVEAQMARIENPDRKRRFEFIRPALSADPDVRDAFFGSLSDEKNRETESWVLSGLRYLHHPLRTQHSEQYIRPSLELLQEVQVTGDIFFPKRWLDVTLGNHSSDEAVATVREFLGERPDYNAQLRMKILQAADPLFRANRILYSEF